MLNNVFNEHKQWRHTQQFMKVKSSTRFPSAAQSWTSVPRFCDSPSATMWLMKRSRDTQMLGGLDEEFSHRHRDLLLSRWPPPHTGSGSYAAQESRCWRSGLPSPYTRRSRCPLLAATRWRHTWPRRRQDDYVTQVVLSHHLHPLKGTGREGEREGERERGGGREGGREGEREGEREREVERERGRVGRRKGVRGREGGRGR